MRLFGDKPVYSIGMYIKVRKPFYTAFNMDLSDVRLTIYLYNVTITSLFGVQESFK
jgi:hypothetical protein